jgi:hypothetical protein
MVDFIKSDCAFSIIYITCMVLGATGVERIRAIFEIYIGLHLSSSLQYGFINFSCSQRLESSTWVVSHLAGSMDRIIHMCNSSHEQKYDKRSTQKYTDSRWTCFTFFWVDSSECTDTYVRLANV